MAIEVDKLLRLLDVGRSLVTELDAEAVLQRILVEAQRATGARYVALGVLNEQRTGLERFLTLGIDDAQRAAIGDLPRGRGVLGVLIQAPHPLRLAHVGQHPQSYGFPPGHPPMESFLGVPIMIRGEAWGNLYLTDKQGAAEFTEADETATVVLADFAATAIDNARGVEADRLRSMIAAADAERARWARELHDETLQALAGLRVGLSGALRRDDPSVYAKATRQAIADIELEIANLRAIISDLRPSLLDDVGLRAALEALLDRRREDALTIDCEFGLPEELSNGTRAYRELETTIYRLVQESLTNIVKHAEANRVDVSITADDRAVLVEVHDDGHGFDQSESTAGFGLAGMRERVFLLGGTLEIASDRGGTSVRARIPRPATTTAAGAQQVAS